MRSEIDDIAKFRDTLRDINRRCDAMEAKITRLERTKEMIEKDPGASRPVEVEGVCIGTPFHCSPIRYTLLHMLEL